MPQPTSHAVRAMAIAVLGTGSDVGKSLITAAVCRLLCRAGVRVAPFKAQNMSLNSFVTPEGGEIGRAQALQAEACGIPPHVDMNPILLKPESNSRSQVIVQGRVLATLDAQAYFARTHHADLSRAVRESYERLASQYEVIVIEGAGSAAEVNLRDRDLVNWPVVEMADAHVVLVGDIDRGGVFAQIIGTLDLIAPEERARVCGIIINKFRGDLSLFADGVHFISGTYRHSCPRSAPISSRSLTRSGGQPRRGEGAGDHFFCRQYQHCRAPRAAHEQLYRFQRIVRRIRTCGCVMSLSQKRPPAPTLFCCPARRRRWQT